MENFWGLGNTLLFIKSIYLIIILWATYSLYAIFCVYILFYSGKTKGVDELNKCRQPGYTLLYQLTENAAIAIEGCWITGSSVMGWVFVSEDKCNTTRAVKVWPSSEASQQRREGTGGELKDFSQAEGMKSKHQSRGWPGMQTCVYPKWAERR